MGRFLPYEPDQAYLVPPSVKDELGEDHLCFFIHQAVEHMDLKSFEQVYGEEGGALYCPALMLKVWLYAYALGITSARRLEQAPPPARTRPAATDLSKCQPRTCHGEESLAGSSVEPCASVPPIQEVERCERNV